MVRLVDSTFTKDKLLTEYRKEMAASGFQRMFSEYINKGDMKAEGSKLVYKTHMGNIKMYIGKINHFYETQKSEAIPKLKKYLDQKSLNLRHAVIKNRGKEGDTLVGRYNPDEFEKIAGPALIEDMATSVKKTGYSNMPVNIVASIGEDVKEISVIPALSEHPGSVSFDSRVIKHDIGLGNIIECELYGTVFEKGF